MLRPLIDISRRLGASPVFIQGAGGNTSVKIGDKLYVKASGRHLRDLDERSGYACCRFDPIRSRILEAAHRGAMSEPQFDALLQQHVIENESFGEPSIETGMHAVIPSRYVLHAHHIYTNVFTCMKNGRAALENIFGKNSFFYLPYYNPGFALAWALGKAITSTAALPPLIFLQNHGVITHHNTPEEALRIMKHVHKTLERFLKEKGGFKPFAVGKAELSAKDHLFPDSAVYARIDAKGLPEGKKRALRELASAIGYIRDTIEYLGGQPVFLSDRDVRIIAGMEKEKKRMSMIAKSAL